MGIEAELVLRTTVVQAKQKSPGDDVFGESLAVNCSKRSGF